MINSVAVLPGVLPAMYIAIMLRSKHTTPVERKRVLAYIPLFLTAVVFALLANQAFTALAVYAESKVDRTLFGWTFPPSWFGSLYLLAIVLLAPVFVVLWTRLGARQPGAPRKFAGAVLLAGLSFVLLALAAYLDSDGKVSPLWLVGTYVLLAIGELMLAPVGLSATTKLAPAAFSSQIMGLSFLAGAAGNGIGILVTQLYSDETELAYFGVLGLCAIVTAVLLYVAAPRIRVLMQGVH